MVLRKAHPKRKQKNIAKRLSSAFCIQVFLFAIAGLIGSKIFWYNAIDLPSECIEIGEEKVVKESNDTFPFLLSYGPYQDTKSGNYLMILRYDTDQKGNIYQVYTDMGVEVMEEGELNPKYHYICTIVRKPDVKIQMLVHYGGIGNIKVHYVAVYPMWRIILMLLFILGCICYLIIGEKWEKHALLFIQCASISLFIGTIYYVDCTANAVKDKWQFNILILAGTLIIMSEILGKIGKKELVFLSSLAECCFIEWRNIINYSYDYMSLYLTALFSTVFLLFIYGSVKGKRLYPVLTSILTIVFSIYSISQYVYFCYFKDFFTLKIIRLFFTAMGATASIQELISEEVLLQMVSLLLYVAVIITISLARRSGRRLLGSRT